MRVTFHAGAASRTFPIGGRPLGEEFDHDDAEALPHCTEMQRCARMTPDERARRCACKRLSTPTVAWKLTRGDRAMLRALRITPE